MKYINWQLQRDRSEQHTAGIFPGIGGIGMSALARYFKATGKKVGGYDRTSTDLTLQLEREGIGVHHEDSADLIPPDFLDPAATLVIITPAIPADHSELAYFHSHASWFASDRNPGLVTRGKKP